MSKFKTITNDTKGIPILLETHVIDSTKYSSDSMRKVMNGIGV